METSQNNDFTFFSFAQIWNKAFELGEDREIKPRDYLYASKLSGVYDVVQEMRGIKPTTPPNGRANRKFMMGKFMEDMFKSLLIQLGIYKESQDRIFGKQEHLLGVSGRLDFTIGGKPTFETLDNVKTQLDVIGADSGIKLFFKNFIKGFKNWVSFLENNSEFEMPDEIIELKTCSSMAFEMVKRNDRAMPSHESQAYHYVFYHPSIRNGRIIYLCKDDGNMAEFRVSAADERLKKQYFKGIEEITEVYNQYKDIPIDLSVLCVSLHDKLVELKADKDADVREIMRISKELREAKVAAFNTNPPLEHLLICDMFTGLLSKNFNVEYSNYLTDYFYTDEDGFAVYFETPEEYRIHVDKACKVNGIMKRFYKNEGLGKGDKNKITAKNQIWIDDLQNKFGFSFEDCYAFFVERQKALFAKGIVLDDDIEE
jgi:hypothetical protein